MVGKFARKSSRAFSNVEMVGQFACKFGRAFTALNSGCGCQCGKMYGPRGVSPTKGSSTGGIIKADLKQMICFVSWLLYISNVCVRHCC